MSKEKLDCYAILEIQTTTTIHDVTSIEIRKAYRRLALKYHPDKGHPNGEFIFKAINTAYEHLNDPILKMEYDSWYGSYFRRKTVSAAVIKKAVGKRDRAPDNERERAERQEEERLRREKEEKKQAAHAERQRKKKDAEQKRRQEEQRRKREQEAKRQEAERQRQEFLRQEREKEERRRQKLEDSAKREREVLEKRRLEEQRRAKERFQKEAEEERKRQRVKQNEEKLRKAKEKFARARERMNRKASQRENDDMETEEPEIPYDPKLTREEYFARLDHLQEESIESHKEREKLQDEADNIKKKAEILEKSAHEALLKAQKKYEEAIIRVNTQLEKVRKLYKSSDEAHTKLEKTLDEIESLEAKYGKVYGEPKDNVEEPSEKNDDDEDMSTPAKEFIIPTDEFSNFDINDKENSSPLINKLPFSETPGRNFLFSHQSQQSTSEQQTSSNKPMFHFNVQLPPMKDPHRKQTGSSPKTSRPIFGRSPRSTRSPRAGVVPPQPKSTFIFEKQINEMKSNLNFDYAGTPEYIKFKKETFTPQETSKQTFNFGGSTASDFSFGSTSTSAGGSISSAPTWRSSNIGFSFGSGGRGGSSSGGVDDFGGSDGFSFGGRP